MVYKVCVAPSLLRFEFEIDYEVVYVVPHFAASKASPPDDPILDPRPPTSKVRSQIHCSHHREDFAFFVFH